MNNMMVNGWRHEYVGALFNGVSFWYTANDKTLNGWFEIKEINNAQLIVVKWRIIYPYKEGSQQRAFTFISCMYYYVLLLKILFNYIITK